MTTLPSKPQLQQPVTIFEPQGSTTSHPNDDVVDNSSAGIFVANDTTILPVKRLVVLIPDVDVDEAQVAREIWEMAAPAHLAVLLLSMCAGVSEELHIQRRLVMLAALIRDPRIKIETRIEYGKNWRRGVNSVLEEGDVILCHAEQRVGLRQKTLINVLDELHVPVWTLSGHYPSSFATRTHWPAGVAFWSVVVAILAGFFFLQIQINNLPLSWAKSVMFYLSVLVEFGSIWAWFSTFA
jgi:hypothetical protein